MPRWHFECITARRTIQTRHVLRYSKKPKQGGSPVARSSVQSVHPSPAVSIMSIWRRFLGTLRPKPHKTVRSHELYNVHFRRFHLSLSQGTLGSVSGYLSGCRFTTKEESRQSMRNADMNMDCPGATKKSPPTQGRVSTNGKVFLISDLCLFIFFEKVLILDQQLQTRHSLSGRCCVVGNPSSNVATRFGTLSFQSRTFACRASYPLPLFSGFQR